jgi:glycosyltransferase involved in cell wall biosynthesis
MHFGEDKTLLLRACSEVDFYVRAVRAERMLREVMRHDGHIFGDWPHIDKVNTRARFHGTIPAENLYQLYSRSRILMNVLPCTMNFVHERIIAALMSEAFSISDGTDFVKQALVNYPNFKSVSIDSPALSDDLDLHISELRKLGSDHKNELQDMLRQSRLRAENEFSLDRLIGEILELASMFQVKKNSSFWTFPP